jgi:tetratricopeptide (TPR) repeat protein
MKGFWGRLIDVILIIAGMTPLFIVTAHLTFAATYPSINSADRAVEIAKRSRDRVERHSEGLKSSSHAMFKEFAERTVSLQKLIDTRQQLEKAGFLKKKDPEGDARRAHINGKILTEVGALKKVCDDHLQDLLLALDTFDEAMAQSLVDSQATRSINSSYEIALEQYRQKEKIRFEQAAEDARKALDVYQDAADEQLKARNFDRYRRAKKRLLQIDQRRKLFETRIKTARMNQEISRLLRAKIRKEGAHMPSKFRGVMSDLYTIFAKVTPVVEMGGTGSPEIYANMGFPNLEELHDTLDIVDSSVDKLGEVLDDMVNDVLIGLGQIKVVEDKAAVGETLSVEEEMEFLRRQRQSWSG